MPFLTHRSATGGRTGSHARSLSAVTWTLDFETYRKQLPDTEAVKTELARSVKLQSEIWSLAVSSSQKLPTTQAIDAVAARAERDD